MNQTTATALNQIATEIAASNLNPRYATELVARLNEAATTHDPEELDTLADILGVYAEAVGLHGNHDDPELVDSLYRWAHTLHTHTPAGTA